MKLKTYMESNGIDAEAAAADIGVAVGSLYRYMDGTRFPRRETLARIAEFTHGAVTANDFVGVQSDPSDPPSPLEGAAA
jgi:transcriptional regulator with XRE-family HTH domain